MATILPVLLFVACATLLSVAMLGSSKILAPRRRTAVKQMPYEAAWIRSMTPVAGSTFASIWSRSCFWCSTWNCCSSIPGPWQVAGPSLGRHAGEPRWRASTPPWSWSGLQPRAGVRRGHGVHRSAGAGLCLRLAERGVSMAIEVPENVVVSKLDSLASWCRKNSLWPMPFATACCGIELMATGASKLDIARFGAEVFRFSPRQCDLMIVAGRVVMKMLPVLQRIWQQMHEPKWCISMGACASTGGVFDTYCVVQGIDRFIPVDMYIPGCPPRPEQLIQAIIDLQDKIQARRNDHAARNSTPPARQRRSGPSLKCRASATRCYGPDG